MSLAKERHHPYIRPPTAIAYVGLPLSTTHDLPFLPTEYICLPFLPALATTSTSGSAASVEDCPFQAWSLKSFMLPLKKYSGVSCKQRYQGARITAYHPFVEMGTSTVKTPLSG